MRLTSFVLLLQFSLLSTFVNAQDEFRIVGYYSLKAAQTGEVKSVPFKQLTHVNLWFLNPGTEGNFVDDLSSLASFVKAAHKHGVKVLFSIGGGSHQPQYQALLEVGQRGMFIESLVEQVIKYELDGLDIDLESANIDENYEVFVTELGIALRAQNKLMTAAIAVYYKDQLTDKAIAQFEFVNVMSYDRTGPWRPEKPGPHALYEHAVDDLTYFGEDRQVPKSKMTLGVPFYGYGYGPELTSKAISMSYGKIVESFKGSELKDEWTMPDGKILYYNGIPTMKKKVDLAKEKASGIMIWQIQGDARGPKSLLRAINRAAK
ncbi:MAG: glycosyl hydrolase family 18 protein [Imperialibacter sp.]|uniref:glycosyl hydrolase family 18 protein n=1 Tax=Imperialibacter sp. TaxID=2038411 RepID=UPI0030D93CC3|tara:strand:- start:281 stop:1237 length:957 start_codon:yes stop_codon:yes gene_type:complete